MIEKYSALTKKETAQRSDNTVKHFPPVWSNNQQNIQKTSE